MYDVQHNVVSIQRAYKATNYMWISKLVVCYLTYKLD